MSFKTKEEMFGDGGGFGAQVPFSTSNPSGTGAGNRGIQFGEQLTAAIANRTHYALALNDENLNTRLASFEGGGMDAAYDNGAVGPAGGGRDITKDGGAVETTSTLASQYADDVANAHFRANAMGDVVRGGGFDFKGGDGVVSYGYLARSNGSMSAAFSSISPSDSATLNPGGAGGDIMRYTGDTAYTGPDTDLMLDGLDFVEISGASAGVNGVYRIHSLGPTVKDFRLRRLDGTSPSFGSGISVTSTYFRARFIGDYTTGAHGAAVSGVENDTSCLGIYTGDVNGYKGSGPTRAVEIIAKRSTGAKFTPSYITGTGQYVSTLTAADFDAADRDTEMRVAGGISSLLVDRRASTGSAHEPGLVYRDVDDSATARAAVENWQKIIETTVLGIGDTINGTFSSPSGRVILPDSDGTPAPPTGLFKWLWANLIIPGATIIEMLSGAEAGNHYLIKKITLTGTGPSDTVPDEFTLVDLDGGSAGLPTSGTFTFRFVIRDQIGSKPVPVAITSSVDTGVTPGETVGFGHTLVGPTTVSLAVHQRAISVVGDMAGVRSGTLPTPAAGDAGVSESWVMTASGKLFLLSDLTVGGHGKIATLELSGGGAFQVTIPQIDLTVNHHLLNGQPEMDNTGLNQWWWDRTNGYWVSLSSSAVMYFPILFTGKLMTTTIQVFGPTGSHSISGSLQSVAPVWGTPASAPTFNDSNTTSVTVSNAWSEIIISHGVGSGTDLVFNDRSWAIRVSAGATGDRIRAMRHSIRYTKIGPGGIGAGT